MDTILSAKKKETRLQVMDVKWFEQIFFTNASVFHSSNQTDETSQDQNNKIRFAFRRWKQSDCDKDKNESKATF